MAIGGYACPECGKILDNSCVVCDCIMRAPSILFPEKAKDKKWDTGKPMVGQMKVDFPNALLAVAEVTKYGVEKYNAPGSWKEVEDALRRYEDALGRHDLSMVTEDYDDESSYLHAAHRAWNSLATLEIILKDKKVKKDA